MATPTLLISNLILVIAVIIFGATLAYDNKSQPGKPVIEEPEPTGETIITFDSQRLWTLINDYRKNKNLPEIKQDQTLCAFADKRAKQIADDWSHEGFNEVSPTSKDVCPECKVVGENLARDYFTPEEILQAWLESPTHKANLTYSFNIGCLGLFIKQTQIFIAFEFGQL